jgi:hypothetical protein
VNVVEATTVCGRPAIGDTSEGFPLNERTCETCLRLLERAGRLASRWIKLVSWHAVKERP